MVQVFVKQDASSMAAPTLKCAAVTDPGRRRENNEDRFHCDPQRGVFAVIDGVGGEAAGEQAAQTAREVLQARLERNTGIPAERIREAITLANNEIYQLAESRPEWKGMACVLTAAVIEGGRATIGHVGDSRLYKLRPGRIEKITHDHSPVGELEDGGLLSEREAMQHPRRNEVYRDVGSEPHAPEDDGFIELLEAPFEPTSALLLSTDGLSDLVASSEILGIIERRAGDPRRAARELVAAANRAGGRDNITVVLVEGAGYATAVRRARLRAALRKVFGGLLGSRKGDRDGGDA
jgi:serine/threonine protein phosphatase PrpC